jgi:hypothetical protein
MAHTKTNYNLEIHMSVTVNKQLLGNLITKKTTFQHTIISLEAPNSIILYKIFTAILTDTIKFLRLNKFVGK